MKLPKEALYAAKAIMYFSSALYLFGFSLNGLTNLSYMYGGLDFLAVAGVTDWLVPFERVLCFALSVGLFVLFAHTVWQWSESFRCR